MPEQVQAVVFDYGGVMTNSIKSIVGAWMQRDGIDPESFTEAMREWLGSSAADGNPVHLLETGQMSVDEFDLHLAARLRTSDGGPVDPSGLSESLFAGMHPDESMFDLVDQLRAHRIPVGLLSNSWGNGYPRQRLDAAFDFVVISGEVGMRKPDLDIYQYCLQGLGASAATTVLVDDAEQNVHGALRAGMQAIRHVGEPSTRSELGVLGLPVTVVHSQGGQ